MKRALIVGCLLAIVLLACIWLYCYNRWSPLWQCETPLPPYEVSHHADDTLRVAFIGDSWTGLRQPETDSSLQACLAMLTGRPVKVRSSGRGGAKSRDIYRFMFDTDGYGTKSLIADGPDYCVVSAGINDAAANLGTRQYMHHMQLMTSFLLQRGVCPVVIEAPDVNIWTIYGDKPKKDLLIDFVKSRMTKVGMYRYADYREALHALLTGNSRALLVPMTAWNGRGPAPNADLFLSDSIHLNRQGYVLLDSCIAALIANDLEKTVDTAMVYNPMGQPAQ